MNSVRNNENTIIIKNSKFICCLYSIRTMDDISLFLDEVQKNIQMLHIIVMHIYWIM